MAFFGLTALGPQNSFQISLLDFSYLDVFTPADQETAFGLADIDKRGYLELDQVCYNSRLFCCLWPYVLVQCAMYKANVYGVLLYLQLYHESVHQDLTCSRY